MTYQPRELEPGVLAAGQMTVDDLARAADAGVRTVVCHRPDGEEPGQPDAGTLRDQAEALGLTFVHAPVSGMPGEEAVERTAGALGGRGDILLFCRSGMRSTVAWALARRMEGADADELRARAMAAGYDLSRVPL